jgi:hypothetical protein
MARWMLLGLFSLTGLFGSLPAGFLAGLPAVFLAGCRKEAPPQPYVRSIDLEALDASCTEAWLRVRFTDSAAPRAFALKRDGQTILSALNSSPDTLVIDEGLLPNRTYTYRAYRLADSRLVDSTTQVSLTTLDSTSHLFQFSIDTLGTHSSVLYDVAIINDTLVYAVGEIFHRDSSENWTFFNLAKWNGREWTLHRVYYRGNNIIHTRWILAFAWNDIWITPYTHWDGTTWREVPFDPIFSGVWTNKAWGTSSSDFYVVGNGGFIAHYDGVRWRRIESGTTLGIQDLSGTVDLLTGRYQVLAVASNKFTNDGVAILQILSTQVIMLPVSGLPTTSLVSIWSANGRKYYVCGDGLYTTNDVRSSWRRLVEGVPPIYKEGVRGNALNDIFVVGDFGLTLHWNGFTWHEYSGSELPYFQGQYQAIYIKGNTVVAVGFLNNARAIVLIGRR